MYIFLNTINAISIPNKIDLQEALKDGKILIKLSNKIQPSLNLKLQPMNMPFNYRENITAFH